MREPLSLGQVDKPSSLKTKVYWIPLDLRQATLECGHSPPTVVRTSSPVQAMQRDSYRDCRIVVKTSEQGLVDPKKAEAVEWGPQHIVVSASKDGTAQETDIAVLKVNVGPKAPAVFPDERGELRFVIASEDVLRKLGDVGEYAAIDIKIKHMAAGSTTLRSELKGAFIPAEREVAAESELRARTRVVPGTTFWVRQGPDRTSIGGRLYFSANANLSLYRTRDRGIGTVQSSSYSSTVQANFGYGIVATVEPWNFSANDAVWPVLSPQINVGVLGPTDFNQKEWWRQMSLVFGLGFRLPAANKPQPGSVEAQTGIIAWGELTGGERDPVILSGLLGVKVSLGSPTF